MQDTPIRDGAIVVKDGVITEVNAFDKLRKKRAEEICDLRNLVLMPGLINCHCHLEEGVMRSEPDMPSGFTPWYTRVTRTIKDADIRKRFNAVRLGVRESLYSGTTTLADTATTGAPFLVLREEKIRSFVFLNFHGLVPWHGKEIFKETEDRINMLDLIFPESLMGLCPEAPYSTSIELYRLAIRKAKKSNLMFQTHLAENSEEFEMFTSHSGPLHEYCQLQHEADLMKYSRGPGFYLFKNNLVPSKCIIIHGNYLSADELGSLARRGASLVHCAQSHEFFGNKDFPFETAFSRGLNICLGTESLASSPSLSLFDEMYCTKKAHPGLESRKVMEFGTVNAAKALGIEKITGTLREGNHADIIGIRVAHSQGENLYDEIVMGAPEVEFMMIKGEELIA